MQKLLLKVNTTTRSFSDWNDITYAGVEAVHGDDLLLACQFTEALTSTLTALDLTGALALRATIKTARASDATLLAFQDAYNEGADAAFTAFEDLSQGYVTWIISLSAAAIATAIGTSDRVSAWLEISCLTAANRPQTLIQLPLTILQQLDDGAPGTPPPTSPTYLTATEVTTAFAPIVHGHASGEISGLGTAATKNVGTTSSTVAAGDQPAAQAAAAVSAHEADHPVPTTRDARNEAAGAAATAVSTHEADHPAPTTRDSRNEVAGAAATAVSTHEADHPAPTTRDSRNEAAGAAATAVSTHEADHPAPTTRDSRNAAADHTHNAFTPDDGTNPGTAGFVPAPAAGDAAAVKVLSAAGTWVEQTGTGGGGGLVWSYVTEAKAAANTQGYLMAGTFTLTMPENPAVGNQVGWRILAGAVTMDGNGQKIEGQAENLVLDIIGAGGVWVFQGAEYGWVNVTEINSSGGGGSVPAELLFACSGEAEELTVGTNKITFRMPYAMTLTGVKASVNSAPTDDDLIIDIKADGTSIFSTLLSIDATEETSVTAAVPAVIDTASLADDAKITVDITQIGSTLPGAGLKLALLGVRA